MMKTVKHTLETIGDRSGHFARVVGSETTDLAKRFGHSTQHLAKRIGLRRGLIGLAMLAAAVGGSVILVRRLRARRLREARQLEHNPSTSSTKPGTRSPSQRTGDVYSH